MMIMKVPVMISDQITARGTFLSGFFASALSAVALSNPTRLKMQATTARLIPCGVTPLSLSWSVSTVKPCLNSTTAASARMSATEMPSNASVISDEILMSL